MLTTGYSFFLPSLLFAAELFPFAPPPSSQQQQRSVEQRSTGSPELSSEDRARISSIATQAKRLGPEDQRKLKSTIQHSLEEAHQKGNMTQVNYFTELLRQIE